MKTMANILEINSLKGEDLKRINTRKGVMERRKGHALWTSGQVADPCENHSTV